MLPNNNVQLSVVKLMWSECYSNVWKQNEHWDFFKKMPMSENPVINISQYVIWMEFSGNFSPIGPLLMNILKNTTSKYMSKHIVLDSQIDAFNSVVRIIVVFLVMRKKSSKLSKVIKSTFSTLIFICIMTNFNILDKRDFKFRGVSSWSRSPVY